MIIILVPALFFTCTTSRQFAHQIAEPNVGTRVARSFYYIPVISLRKSRYSRGTLVGTYLRKFVKDGQRFLMERLSLRLVTPKGSYFKRMSVQLKTVRTLVNSCLKDEA